jgi:hypothetical protein
MQSVLICTKESHANSSIFFKYSEITDVSVGSIGSRLIIGKLLFCWVEKLNYWISLGWERVAQPLYYFFWLSFQYYIESVSSWPPNSTSFIIRQSLLKTASEIPSSY